MGPKRAKKSSSAAGKGRTASKGKSAASKKSAKGPTGVSKPTAAPRRSTRQAAKGVATPAPQQEIDAASSDDGVAEPADEAEDEVLPAQHTGKPPGAIAQVRQAALAAPKAQQQQDDTIDPDEPEAGDYIGDPVQTEQRNVQFQGANATLRISLQVHRDSACTSRLGYYATFYLVQPRRQPQKVGYISSWRIDKQTSRNADAKRSAWKDVLLTKRVDGVAVELKETAVLLQALYNKQGHPRGLVKNKREQLRDESLLHLQMVYIFRAYQGNGLLQPALTLFHEVLALLPEWFVFRGSIVLVPGAPAYFRGDQWEGVQNVETILQDQYERKGGYEVWIQNARVPSAKNEIDVFIVMGRTVHLTPAETQDAQTQTGQNEEQERDASP